MYGLRLWVGDFLPVSCRNQLIWYYNSGEAVPHFAPQCGDVFFGDVHVQVSPQSIQAVACYRGLIFPVEEFHIELCKSDSGC